MLAPDLIGKLDYFSYVGIIRYTANLVFHMNRLQQYEMSLYTINARDLNITFFYSMTL